MVPGSISLSPSIESRAQVFIPVTTIKERYNNPAIVSYGRPATQDVGSSLNSQPSGLIERRATGRTTEY